MFTFDDDNSVPKNYVEKMISGDNKRGPSVVELMLWSWGFVLIFSSFIWIITANTDKWAWFSRFALGMIAFGFAGVMREIRKSRK